MKTPNKVNLLDLIDEYKLQHTLNMEFETK